MPYDDARRSVIPSHITCAVSHVRLFIVAREEAAALLLCVVCLCVLRVEITKRSPLADGGSPSSIPILPFLLFFSFFPLSFSLDLFPNLARVIILIIKR